MKDRLLNYFAYDHLPQHLQNVSAKFYSLAVTLCRELPGSAERTVALRKLLEAKDAAVRAAKDAHEEAEAIRGAIAPPEAPVSTEDTKVEVKP